MISMKVYIILSEINEKRPTNYSDIISGWFDIEAEQIVFSTVTKTPWPTDTGGFVYRREHKQKLQKGEWIELPWIFPTRIKQSFDIFD